MITIAHRIQLMPNNKQRTYFRKAIGCCRFAYNWGLEEWKRRYKDGERGLTGRKLCKDFNAIRGEQFPFTYEVTKCATEHAFSDLQTAFDNFFAEHMYTSYIIGDDNMFDRMIVQGQETLTEEFVHRDQERIASELLNMELDLWEY